MGQNGNSNMTFKTTVDGICYISSAYFAYELHVRSQIECPNGSNRVLLLLLLL